MGVLTAEIARDANSGDLVVLREGIIRNLPPILAGTAPDPNANPAPIRHGLECPLAIMSLLADHHLNGGDRPHQPESGASVRSNPPAA